MPQSGNIEDIKDKEIEVDGRRFLVNTKSYDAALYKVLMLAMQRIFLLAYRFPCRLSEDPWLICYRKLVFSSLSVLCYGFTVENFAMSAEIGHRFNDMP